MSRSVSPTHATSVARRPVPGAVRRFTRRALAVTALGGGILAVIGTLPEPPSRSSVQGDAEAAYAVAPPIDPRLLEARPVLADAAPGFRATPPLAANWRPARLALGATPPRTPIPPDGYLVARAPLAVTAPSSVPLPAPRPFASASVAADAVRTAPAGIGLGTGAGEMGAAETPMPARLAGRASLRRRHAAAAAAAPAPDTRSFLEKLFSLPAAAGPTYAALGRGTVEAAPPGRLSPVPYPTGGGTAVYDITARTLTLPGGHRLEAHSGLGPKLDDPRYVHVRMQGATPPGTYDLTERERLFHGVRALRLNPVGGPGAVHGRSGLLAHTFMLGPNGDSNGCVSLRDYDRLLQAYLRGEVRRLVVVAGGRDASPALAWGRPDGAEPAPRGS